MAHAQTAAPTDLGMFPPWWQILGAFLVVIALLIIFLRLLSRLQTGQTSRAGEILETHSVGPGRTVEVLRYRETVYSIYRHDAAGILLETRDADQYVPTARGPRADALRRLPFVDRLFGRGAGGDGA